MAEKALDLFEQMLVQPNNVIYMIIFKACAELMNERAKTLGNKLLHQIRRTSMADHVVLSSAIQMLMKFGCVHDAEDLFESMRSKDVLTYGIMMKGKHFVYISHPNMCHLGYLLNAMANKALDLFERMPLTPNGIVYSTVFQACAAILDERSITLGNKLIHSVSNQSTTDVFVFNSALQMLTKFDDVKRAEHLFQSIKNKDMYTFGSMMKLYNLNQQPLKSLQLFRMIKEQGLISSAPIFTLTVNACSQIGILSVCQSIVDQIPSDLYDNELILNALIDMWVSIYR